MAAPAFSPEGGAYPYAQRITLTSATPGAVIRYTTNGLDPTASDPTIASGGTLRVGNFTLKARAYLTGATASAVTSAVYALSVPPAWSAAAGFNHSVLLNADGTVWTWGRNTDGVLGDDGPGRSAPGVVANLTGITAVSSGAFHVLALDADGAVWAWGANADGQLGADATVFSRAAPAPVSGLPSVSAIAAGSFFSVALATDGTVWTWGDNEMGQLGDGTRAARSTPSAVPDVTDVVALAAGDAHVVVRKRDGSLWAWGNNESGQLGDGTSELRLTPVRVPNLTAAAGPWAGYAHAFAATTDGALWAWGANAAGQLGLGAADPMRVVPTLVPTLTNVRAIAAAGHSVAVRDDSSVWTWGNNALGSIGDGSSQNRTAPYQIPGLTNVGGVAAGLNHTVVTTTDGAVWAWGYNGDGEIGDGTIEPRAAVTPVSEPGTLWKTSTPTLWPPPGTYQTITTVTLRAATPGAMIHYTTNGAMPSPTAPAVVSGGSITIDRSLTLLAAAWAPGYTGSNVTSFAYTLKVPPPAMMPPGGTFEGSVTVTLTSPLAGTTVRYTLDGSAPTTTSSLYAGPLTVTTSTTIQARAFRSGWTASDVATATYQIAGGTSIPVITNVSPLAGSPGTQVAINGVGFGETQGSGQVWLGTVAGVVASWSDGQVVATVAAGSKSGNVQVLQHGVWSNAVAFTVSGPPRLDAISPTAGAAGTSVTLWGSGFGSSQGDGLVWIGGAGAMVTAWSDTLVSATVPGSAVTGVVKVQQNGLWSNAVSFLVPATLQVTLVPNVMGLVVGEHRSVQTLDGQGAAVTGLLWTSSDPGIVTLTSDDPSVVTAIAPGTATIRAGTASADVTVYAGALPDGAVRWSTAGTGSGVFGSYIAVPNYDGVADVFLAQHDGHVQAIRGDGTVAWTATVPTNEVPSFIPDFQGGLVVASQSAISRLAPLTGEPSPAFRATTQETQSLGLAAPAVHPDGTMFTIDYACHDFCGRADATDGAWVVGVNPSTAAETVRVPLATSTYMSEVSDATFCQSSTPGLTTSHYHAWPVSGPHIAGDGFLYLSYVTEHSSGTLQRAAVQPYTDAQYDLWDQLRVATSTSDFARAVAALDALGPAIGTTSTSALVSSLHQALQDGDRTTAIGIENQMVVWFLRPCDSTTTRVQELHLLRVGVDGTSSDVVVKQWEDSGNTVYSLAPWWTGGVLAGGTPAFLVTETHTGPAAVDAYARVITNADTGALYSWQATQICYGSATVGYRTYIQTDECPTAPEDHLTTMANGAVASDVTWNPGARWGQPVEPVLQLEGGAFAGTARTASGDVLVVFTGAGQIAWTLPGHAPVFATPGGGLLASAGTGTYAFDADGTAVGQGPAVPTYSWTQNAYASGRNAVSQMEAPVVELGTSYAAMPGGNPSANGTAIGVTTAEWYFLSGVKKWLFALADWGGSCKRPADGVGIRGELSVADLELYMSMKQRLLAGQTLDAASPNSQQCQAYFNRIGATAYFPLLQNAVNNQQVFDGLKTTMTRYSAGLYDIALVDRAANLKVLTDTPVCSLFVTSTKKNLDGTFDTKFALAWAQAAPQTPPEPGAPVKNVYLDPRFVRQHLTPATVLHEALHNVTGMDDERLSTLLEVSTEEMRARGTVVMDTKLRDQGCTVP